jgi:hypothetical protein
MSNRLYDNGMLSSGEARHCNYWEYPTMPRLHRDGPAVDDLDNPTASVEPRSRNHGYVAFFFNMFRSH